MPKPFPRALCWLRRDLRLSDHRPLQEATRLAEQTAVVFVFDRNILSSLPRADRRVDFLHRSLVELDGKLRAHGSQLVVRHGNPVEEIPAVAAAFGAGVVVTGRDYEPYARERDAAVGGQVNLQTVKDHVVFEGGQIFSQSGTPFRVYSPYARAWKALLSGSTALDEAEPDLSGLADSASLAGLSNPWDLGDLGFDPTELWLEAGEDAGLARLTAFEKKARRYKEDRDFPAIDGTSGLSVHFRFGTVSIREAARRAVSFGPNHEKWLNELIWREFYQDLLWHHPGVVKDTFQPQYRDLVYPGAEADWQAWCEGKTGYPILDAAMRCLNATGWMHNRLRMIVASFLTKDLLIDYRRGEAYFAEKLLDFDLASNNGGWQWAASTGADAQPYFRIFNPLLQSVKFDPTGAFIRQWVPELADLSDADLHAPFKAKPMDLLVAGVTLGETYPHPVVDHFVQKELALALLSGPTKQPE
jgi:deoxyribodipyrimidine photo-lyase